MKSGLAMHGQAFPQLNLEWLGLSHKSQIAKGIEG